MWLRCLAKDTGNCHENGPVPDASNSSSLSTTADSSLARLTRCTAVIARTGVLGGELSVSAKAFSRLKSERRRMTSLSGRAGSYGASYGSRARIALLSGWRAPWAETSPVTTKQKRAALAVAAPSRRTGASVRARRAHAGTARRTLAQLEEQDHKRGDKARGGEARKP